MTVPQYLGSIAILFGLIWFGCHVWDDLARLRRATRAEYVREWHLASARPYDRENEAA